MTDPPAPSPPVLMEISPNRPTCGREQLLKQKQKKAVSSTPGWERELLEKTRPGHPGRAARARRWRNFWRFGWLALITLIIWAAWQRDLSSTSKSTPHTAVVDVKGEIAAGAEASAEFVVAAMKSAFEDPGSQAVVLLINSPGGNPGAGGHDQRRDHPPGEGQAQQAPCTPWSRRPAPRPPTHRRGGRDLRGQGQHRRQHRRADGRLWLHRHHGKLGVERRLLTAGENNKGFLDPSARSRPRSAAMRSRCSIRSPPAVHRGREEGRASA